jgi:hypothetical protein
MIYSAAVAECRRFGYRDGCPVAESVADRLITLPNYAELSTSDIDAVAQVFLSSVQACRGVRAGLSPYETRDPGARQSPSNRGVQQAG